MAAKSPSTSASGTAIAAVAPPSSSVLGSRIPMMFEISRPVASDSPRLPVNRPASHSK